MKKKEDKTLIILVTIFILAIIGLIGNKYSITGADITATDQTESKVVINEYIAMIKSDGLSEINFGAIEADQIENQNATNNTFFGNFDDLTGYNLTLNSNRDVGICLQADSPLSSGPNTIPTVGGYSYSYCKDDDSATCPIVDGPSYGDSSSPFTVTGSYENPLTILGDLQDNDIVHFRFYLDIPEDQLPGTYINNILFKAYLIGVGSC